MAPGLIIPCLPDELALLCLARLPYRNGVLLRRVSKAWRKALGRPNGPRLIIWVASELSREKKTRRNGADTSWYVFDPVLCRCESIPAPLAPPSGPPGIPQCLHARYWQVLAGGSMMLAPVIALLGPHTFCLEMENADKVEGTRYLWRQGACMKEKNRWDYAAVVEEKGRFAYVAGGQVMGILSEGSGGKKRMVSTLFKSAERFDVKRRCWQRLPDMHEPRAHAKPRMLPDGRFCISAGTPPKDNYEYGEAYDASTRQWSVVHCPLVLYADFHDTPRVHLKDHHYLIHFTSQSPIIRHRFAQLKRVAHSDWYHPETIGMVPIPADDCHQTTTRLIAMGCQLFVFTGNSLLITSPFVLPLRWTRLHLPFNSQLIYSQVVFGDIQPEKVISDDGYALRISATELKMFM